ncbi:MAG TPA: hypothetical protein VFE47_24675, partial [Tepidisphaeraceae bacterium]|nr:hypothetical protein [Tepidisphaeraceae bacterium]
VHPKAETMPHIYAESFRPVSHPALKHDLFNIKSRQERLIKLFLREALAWTRCSFPAKPRRSEAESKWQSTEEAI